MRKFILEFITECEYECRSEIAVSGESKECIAKELLSLRNGSDYYFKYQGRELSQFNVDNSKIYTLDEFWQSLRKT